VFGRIRRKEMGDKLEKEDEMKVDKGKMELNDGIGGLGFRNVGVKVEGEVEGRLKVEVREEG
ncbi:50S ribosomal L9 C-terminal domain-containing protein, partial [Bacillus altitudinis]|uniref:50S ribosomal L9 C-terminal domain-containing protein n=1 Tax=Bacillus altitudinis TaxID=293387 RepID=UPI00235260D2